jgi:hypothetical protein
MLIHRQNSNAPRSKQRTGSREVQSRGTRQQSKNAPCTSGIHMLDKTRNFKYGH